MNKKLMTTVGMVAVALSLTACGKANDHTSAHSSATSASVKPVHHAVRYSNAEYALMAYLTASKQDLIAVHEAVTNINWQKSDDQYLVTSDGQQYTIQVQSSKVIVNDAGQQTTYTKRALAKKFSDKQALDKLLQRFDHSTDDENSASGSNNQQAAPQAAAQASDNDGHINIAGHSFHHEDFYGNDVLVGDNNEGEAGEFFTNDPSLNEAQRHAAGSIAASQEHPNPN